jgi:hypothetical protein
MVLQVPRHGVRRHGVWVESGWRGAAHHGDETDPEDWFRVDDEGRGVYVPGHVGREQPHDPIAAGAEKEEIRVCRLGTAVLGGLGVRDHNGGELVLLFWHVFAVHVCHPPSSTTRNGSLARAVPHPHPQRCQVSSLFLFSLSLRVPRFSVAPPASH